MRFASTSCAFNRSTKTEEGWVRTNNTWDVAYDEDCEFRDEAWQKANASQCIASIVNDKFSSAKVVASVLKNAIVTNTAIVKLNDCMVLIVNQSNRF